MMKRETPCHFARPFIDRFGRVFPCCFKNSDECFVIGNVSDADLSRKFAEYDVNCECDFLKFRKAGEKDAPLTLHIQTSLKCHGKCAVCYVGAPQKKGDGELDYEKAFSFIQQAGFRQIFLEGGEVPIQPEAMAFAARIRSELEPKRLHLLTNGCYKDNVAEKVAKIFTAATISHMGFLRSTYYVETCLDIETTKCFSHYLHDHGLDLGLRYIITPLTLPEIGEFLKYAAEFTKTYVTLADCDINLYINLDTGADYWRQIITRSQIESRKGLLETRSIFKEHQNSLRIEPRTAKLLNIDDTFKDKFSLDYVLL